MIEDFYYKLAANDFYKHDSTGQLVESWSTLLLVLLE